MFMKHFVAALLLALAASPAHANWLYNGGEGSYYAYITDGGFVDDSFENGLMVRCSDDSEYCTLRVWIEDKLPRPPAAVTFTFASGKTITRIAEAPGGIDPIVDFDKEMYDALRSEESVTVSVPRVGSYTFSLKGSSRALSQATDRS